MASAVRLVGQIATAEAEIRKWEDHHGTFANCFREAFFDMIKAGVLLQMLPRQAHDSIQQTLGHKVTYDDGVEGCGSS